MELRWQDEIKYLSNSIYKPEKEKWERDNNREIGFSHWYIYISKYAELRRREICRGNSLNIALERMKRLHPVVWSLATDVYNQQ